MENIEEYRKEIDNIADEILKLLVRRKEIVKEIWDYKKGNGIGIVDEGRESEIFQRLGEKSEKLGLDKNYVKEIFKKIIERSKEIQNGN